MSVVRLGLIGENIAASSAPRLHEVAGRLAGIPTRYELLDPRALGLDFDGAFEMARKKGFRGLNITHPFKARAVARCAVAQARIRRLGAVNTVVFESGGEARGANTDFSGFLAVLDALAPRPLGACCQIGAGGVGRAVAFALAERGAARLALVERDLARAEALAQELRAAFPALEVAATDDAAQGARGAAGILNCTPVGMGGEGGSPIPAEALRGAAWAFDAVYTPERTRFLQDAAAAGLTTIGGWELFFAQGLDAFAAFHGRPCPEPARLRALLRGAQPGTGASSRIRP